MKIIDITIVRGKWFRKMEMESLFDKASVTFESISVGFQQFDTC